MKQILLLQRLCSDMKTEDTYTHNFDFLLTQFRHVIHQQNSHHVVLSTTLSLNKLQDLITRVDNRLEVLYE